MMFEAGMRRQLLLTAILGAWLAGTVFMWMTAIKNFETVDVILASPPQAFDALTSEFAPEDLREAMRYQASEVNRLFFAGWGTVQMLLGLGALVLAWKGRGDRILLGCIVGAVVIAGVLQAVAVPETIRLGRIIDFGAGSPAETAAFWRYHHTYTGLDMTKFVLLIVAIGSLSRRDRTR